MLKAQVHPSHALLPLEQDEKIKWNNWMKNLLVKFPSVSAGSQFCVWLLLTLLAQRPLGFTAPLTSHLQFSLALPNLFPKGFEEPVSIVFSKKYHPLNTRWHRWPPQGWRRAQVLRAGLNLFIQLIYEKPFLVLPRHPLSWTNLSSCFIPLG